MAKWRKKGIQEAKFKAYDELYSKVGMKDGAKNIYKNLLRKEINCVKCIKDKDHIMLIKEEEITEKWENYFW